MLAFFEFVQSCGSEASILNVFLNKDSRLRKAVLTSDL